MGIYRSYSNSLLLASHQGKSFNRRQWNLLFFLVFLLTTYVFLTFSFSEFLQSPADHRTSTSNNASFFSTVLTRYGASHPARAQHLHRVQQHVTSAEQKVARDRESHVQQWQVKIDALQAELKEMHEKVEQNEALEADLWQLRKELSEAHKERTSLFFANYKVTIIDEGE